MRDWLDVVEDLDRQVRPLLGADAQALAQGFFDSGEGLLFASIILAEAAESRVAVEPRLLEDVERLIVHGSDGPGADLLRSSLATLSQPAA